MKNVLLIDDEERMLELLSLYLQPHHFKCTKALGAEAGLRALEKEVFDVVLLDIMMAGMDGFALCEEIRRFSEVPIIMVTAREQQRDIVKGLSLGADDYITKPFDERELIARINALLRRTKPTTQIRVSGLVWDEEQFELSYSNQKIRLTPKEFSLIGLLMKNPGRVFPREQLINLIWGMESETEGRTVDSHVRNIRDKIRRTGFPLDEYLQTVWGVGYKWLKK